VARSVTMKVGYKTLIAKVVIKFTFSKQKWLQPQEALSTCHVCACE
jgi:hypothetical protein